MKRSPLKRRTSLRARPKRVLRTPEETAWKKPVRGFCDCCSRPCWRLEHHHVVSQNRIKQEGRHDMLWDPRNGMYLHPDCHERHTNASRRIPLSKVPEDARQFAVELLGFHPAILYLSRYYAGSYPEEKAA